jgi:hypothetical protein
MDLELIDGNPVVSHVVRFKDRTTITDTDADAVRDGAVIVWIVRTRCQPPSYHPVAKDSDDRYRFNIQTVEAAAVLHDELRDGAIAYLDDPTQNQGRLIFGHPTHTSEPGPAEITTNLVFHETPAPEKPVDSLADFDVPEPAPPEPYPQPSPQPEPEPQPARAITAEDLAGDLAEAADVLGAADVRTVGYVYGHEASPTHKLMSEMWDDL